MAAVPPTGNGIAFVTIAFVVNLLFIITAAYATYYTNTKDETTPEKTGHSFSIAMLTISCVTMLVLVVFIVLMIKQARETGFRLGNPKPPVITSSTSFANPAA